MSKAIVTLLSDKVLDTIFGLYMAPNIEKRLNGEGSYGILPLDTHVVSRASEERLASVIRSLLYMAHSAGF